VEKRGFGRKWNRKGIEGRRKKEGVRGPIHHGNRIIFTILPFQHVHMYYFFFLYDSLQ
jgi:hypothetical protein